MDKNCTMAELLAEYGERFDILEEIKKENKKLYHPEECEEEVVEQPQQEQQEVEEVEKKKEKDNKPKDITIKCKKCEQDWVWTVADQQFYKEKGFFKPSLCKDCRKKMKVVNNFHKD